MLTPEILSGLFGQPRSEGAILVSEPLFFQDFLREFYMPSPANNPSENFFSSPNIHFLGFQLQTTSIGENCRIRPSAADFVQFCACGR